MSCTLKNQGKVRHWSCPTCKMTKEEVKLCRIRHYNYTVFRKQCPREDALEAE